MTYITSSKYPGIYSYTNSSLSGLLNTTTGKSAKDETAPTVLTGDTVSLSSSVTTARTREYLGLSPTGKLALSDFETAAAEQKQSVSTMLASAMKELGIDADQQISLSLDNNNNIVIKEEFEGKKKLEESLNNEESFVQAFSGLSANNEIMDYADALKTRSMTLANYINEDTSDTDLLSIAAKYTEIKSNTGNIETLWSLSHSETPYTYRYNETEDV